MICKITGEMLEEAIKTSHDACTNDCIHANAMNEIAEKFNEEIAEVTLMSLVHGKSPIIYVYIAAFHLGYRLRQIVERHEKEVAELEKLV